MERYQGYLSALLDAGMEVNEDYVFLTKILIAGPVMKIQSGC